MLTTLLKFNWLQYHGENGNVFQTYRSSSGHNCYKNIIKNNKKLNLRKELPYGDLNLMYSFIP
jgi:hypothetical protein